MGRGWVLPGKMANAAKKGALFTKIMKEVAAACREGGASPDGNARLRAALESARKASVPKDTIKRAIDKATGAGATAYETVTYEGFAPHQVPVIVVCLTDNKNRTASDIRVLFRAGQMSSVGWMFDQVGIIEATHADASLDLETVAIEAGAQDFRATDKADLTDGAGIGGTFYTSLSDLDAVNKFLSANGWAVSKAERGYKAKTPVELSDAQHAEVAEFLNAIDDNDDVHRVYTALD